jgi:carboxyl-terminal processing protease
LSRRILPRPPAFAAFLAALLVLSAPALAPAAPLPEDARLVRARTLEQAGKWLEACRVYDELARLDRDRDDYRAGYRRCLRRYHLAERHRDPAYHKAVERLTPTEALDVYRDVLAKVDECYVDHDRADVVSLFRQGVDELQFALGEEPFRRACFPGARPDAVREFADRLTGWRGRTVSGREEARREVRELARAAEEAGLAAREGVVKAFALEFACGCCNALDEYTLFLAPGHYGAFQAALEGKVAGVGLEVAALPDGQLALTRVYARTPADEAGLEPGLHLLRVDRRAVGLMPAEAAAELLRGEPGSVVEVEVRTPGAMTGRSVKLTRRPLSGVRYAELRDPFGPSPSAGGGVWLLNIGTFQRSTAKEVQEALIEMGRVDMGRPGLGALVLDLRGNPGGLLDPAVQVAELFLGDAVVAYSSGYWAKYNRAWEGRGLSPQTVPLAVLVDGDTASAAEVLAGALKEQGRARLYGQTTYGKGSIQVEFRLRRPPLDKMPGALRMTVAKLYSPSKQPYAGRGVAPDVAVPADGDEAVDAAARELRTLVKPRMGLMPPG